MSGMSWQTPLGFLDQHVRDTSTSKKNHEGSDAIAISKVNRTPGRKTASCVINETPDSKQPALYVSFLPAIEHISSFDTHTTLYVATDFKL